MGHKDVEIKKLKKRITELESTMGGKLDAEYEARIDRNSWHDCALEELFPVIKETIEKSRNREWTWARNWDCKYIDVRIDMRDGGAILRSRSGRISPEQLKYQYKSDGEEDL